MQQYFGKEKIGETLFLHSYDENHIKNVMRFKCGDKVFVVFENVRYLCEFNSDLLSASIVQELEEKLESEIVAFVPILQEEKMSFVIEKGTELGVTHFIPVYFSRCKYKLDKRSEEKKLVRWNRICKEAAEQSRRFSVPVVSNVLEVGEFVGKSGVNILCSLDKEGVKHISKVLNEEVIHGTISLLFGPEGGITNEEEDTLVSNGFVKTSLGSTVLRSETVIISVLSIINYLRK